MAGLDRSPRHNSAGLTRTRSVNNETGRFAIHSPSGTIIGESDEQPAPGHGDIVETEGPPVKRCPFFDACRLSLAPPPDLVHVFHKLEEWPWPV